MVINRGAEPAEFNITGKIDPKNPVCLNTDPKCPGYVAPKPNCLSTDPKCPTYVAPKNNQTTNSTVTKPANSTVNGTNTTVIGTNTTVVKN